MRRAARDPREVAEDAEPARRAAPPGPAASILDLQRAHGNAAVARMLAAAPATATVARFTRNVTNYSFAGAGTLFSSQEISKGTAQEAPDATRSRVDIGAGGALEQTKQHYTPGAKPVAGQAPSGSWGDDVGPAAPVAGNPPMRVSQNRRFAVQDVAQPRLFFADAAAIATANATLVKKGNIRILPTGGPTITLATGEVLVQAAIEKKNTAGAYPGQVATFVATACNDVANQVMGSTSAGGVVPLNPAAQPNAAAAPAVGQSFAWQSKFDETRATSEVMPTKDRERDAMVSAALAEWQQLEAAIESGIDAAHMRFSSKARAMQFGWASHFEGVILEDGGDRLTLVNYNRATELRHEKRKLFADLYARIPAFRARFLALVKEEQKKAQADNKAARKKGRPAQEFDWLRVMTLMDPLRQELRDTIKQDAPAALLDRMAEHERVIDEQSPAMWYFDVYGSGADSFDSRYAGAGRGAGGSTRVLS